MTKRNEIISRIENLGFSRNPNYDQGYESGTEFKIVGEAWEGFGKYGDPYLIIICSNDDTLKSYYKNGLIGSYVDIEDLLSDIGFDDKIIERYS